MSLLKDILAKPILSNVCRRRQFAIRFSFFHAFSPSPWNKISQTKSLRLPLKAEISLHYQLTELGMQAHFLESLQFMWFCRTVVKQSAQAHAIVYQNTDQL